MKFLLVSLGSFHYLNFLHWKRVSNNIINQQIPTLFLHLGSPLSILLSFCVTGENLDRKSKLVINNIKNNSKNKINVFQWTRGDICRKAMKTHKWLMQKNIGNIMYPYCIPAILCAVHAHSCSSVPQTCKLFNIMSL